jgi:hypothetical protein
VPFCNVISPDISYGDIVIGKPKSVAPLFATLATAIKSLGDKPIIDYHSLSPHKTELFMLLSTTVGAVNDLFGRT